MPYLTYSTSYYNIKTHTYEHFIAGMWPYNVRITLYSHPMLPGYVALLDCQFQARFLFPTVGSFLLWYLHFNQGPISQRCNFPYLSDQQAVWIMIRIQSSSTNVINIELYTLPTKRLPSPIHNVPEPFLRRLLWYIMQSSLSHPNRLPPSSIMDRPLCAANTCVDGETHW